MMSHRSSLLRGPIVSMLLLGALATSAFAQQHAMSQVAPGGLALPVSVSQIDAPGGLGGFSRAPALVLPFTPIAPIAPGPIDPKAQCQRNCEASLNRCGPSIFCGVLYNTCLLRCAF